MLKPNPQCDIRGPCQEGGVTERSLAPSDTVGSLQPRREPLLDSKFASHDLGLPRLQNYEKQTLFVIKQWFPDLRLRRLSFEYPGSAGAGPRHPTMAREQ